MRLLKPTLLFLPFIVIGLSLSGLAQAGSKACKDLVSPLHQQVNGVKDRGGIWGQFEKSPGLQDHSALALRLDSKIIGLMFTLDYLCDTERGVPFNDVAEYVVPRIKKKGEDKFIQDHVALGHSLKDVSDWVKFAKFAESNLDRKLDIKRIGETVKAAGPHVERYKILFENKNPASAMMAGSKALIKAIEKLRATDPYLKQADFENNQIPHSSALSNTGDEM